MPLLFALGISSALRQVQAQLHEGEHLFAYLDDVYAIAEPDRIRPIYDALVANLRETAAIELHAGKTRTWNRGGVKPPNMDDLGADVWSPAGVKVLGTPIGTDEFVASQVAERLEDERRLWDALLEVPDLQCAWQILVQCAGPRASHLLRTLPPSQSRAYAMGHDDGMWQTACRLLEPLPGNNLEHLTARMLATLPQRLGGVGLRSAERTGPAAYWASWADALAMINQRLPYVAEGLVEALSSHHSSGDEGGCVSEIRTAADLLDREGFVQRPDWTSLREGIRPPQKIGRSEPGEWAHGWQYYASSTREHSFRESVLLSQSRPTDQAHLRSHSGQAAGAALAATPTCPEFEIKPLAFRTLLLERLRLPLPLADATCEGCGRPLDERGFHRAACPCSGRLKRRATPVERAVARICREAGAVVRTEARLKDMNLGIAAADGRRIDVLAQGLPCRSGAQLAVDVTLRSPVTARGEAQPRAATIDGAVAERARRDKEDAYPELVACRRCVLVVMAIETGGRWSAEAMAFVEELAAAKARDSPKALRFAAALAWQRRWTRLLAVACANSFASCLVAPRGELSPAHGDGPTPALCDLLSRGEMSPSAPVSRQPLRG